MFNLFKKKGDLPKVRDVIWLNSEKKWKALRDRWKENNDILFVSWFDDTASELEESLPGEMSGKINLVTARELQPHQVEGKAVIFAEHYPLKKKEDELFQKLHLHEVTVFSALDEPLFKRFGSEKIVQLMKQMGMSENQAIEHSMITKAIQNAQDKLEGKVNFEQSARSQKDWLEKNLKA